MRFATLAAVSALWFLLGAGGPTAASATEEGQLTAAFARYMEDKLGLVRGRRSPKFFDRSNVPEFLMDHTFRTGSAAPGRSTTTNFAMPGSLTGNSNVARNYPARLRCSGPSCSTVTLTFDHLSWATLRVVKSAEGNNEVFWGRSGLRREPILAAELRLFWRANGGGQNNRTTRGTFRMNVHDRVRVNNRRGPAGSAAGSEDDDEDGGAKFIMDTRKVHYKDDDIDSGWYSFNVMPALERRQARLLRQLGEVGDGGGGRRRCRIDDGAAESTCRVKVDLELVLDLMPVQKGSGGTGGVAGRRPEGRVEEAHLLVFTEDPVHKETRLRRSPGEQRRRLFRKGQHDGSRRRTAGPGHQAACRLYHHYVDFKDIGWSDWILSPIGYDMNFCAGGCPYPMADSLNTTNHAIFQLLLHRRRRNHKDGDDDDDDDDSRQQPRVPLPPPCCVPTELTPITMLYIEDKVLMGQEELSRLGLSEKVEGQRRPRGEPSQEVLKVINYENMSATSCGCR